MQSKYAKRNALIVEGFKAGKNRKELCVQFHLSKERIRQVCAEAGMSINQHKEVRNRQVLSDYKKGMSVKQLGEKHRNIPLTTITYILSEAGAVKQRRQARNRQIIAQFRRGVCIKDIAATHHICTLTVRSVLLSKGLLKTRKRLQGAALAQRNSKAAELYLKEVKKGMNMKEVARRFGLHPVYFSRVLNTQGISPIKEITKRQQQRNLQILQRYKDGVPAKEIARRFGLTTLYINRIVRMTKSNMGQTGKEYRSSK